MQISDLLAQIEASSGLGSSFTHTEPGEIEVQVVTEYGDVIDITEVKYDHRTKTVLIHISE